MAPFFLTDAEHSLLRKTEASDPTAADLSVENGIRDDARPIYIFGAGHFGGFAYDFLSAIPGVESRIRGFIDNNPAVRTKIRKGLPVLSPEAADGSSLIVLGGATTPGPTGEMADQCRSLGLAFVSYGLLLLGRNAGNGRIHEVMDLWEDRESSEVYRLALRHAILREVEALGATCVPDQYFPAFMPRKLYRSFVDGGASSGDTLLDFKARFGYDYDNYYAFEPSEPSYRLLLEAADDPRIRCFQGAISDVNGPLPFLWDLDQNFANSGEGNDVVAGVTLDSTLAGRPVTMIKMDVEGAEPEALEGAKDIVAGQRPALAISVYHRPEHLWELPLWMKRRYSGYRLRLRHHHENWHETICYAVP